LDESKTNFVLRRWVVPFFNKNPGQNTVKMILIKKGENRIIGNQSHIKIKNPLIYFEGITVKLGTKLFIELFVFQSSFFLN
jgi:hypothetical protein